MKYLNNVHLTFKFYILPEIKITIQKAVKAITNSCLLTAVASEQITPTKKQRLRIYRELVSAFLIT